MAGDTGREIICVEGIIDAISPSQVAPLASESIIITVCALEMAVTEREGSLYSGASPQAMQHDCSFNCMRKK